jgi:hypothetical protein
MSIEPAQSASTDPPFAASLTVGQPFQADMGAEKQNDIRSTLNGTEDGLSLEEKQLGAPVRPESLTYITSVFPG